MISCGPATATKCRKPQCMQTCACDCRVSCLHACVPATTLAYAMGPNPQGLASDWAHTKYPRQSLKVDSHDFPRAQFTSSLIGLYWPKWPLSRSDLGCRCRFHLLRFVGFCCRSTHSDDEQFGKCPGFGAAATLFHCRPHPIGVRTCVCGAHLILSKWLV